MADILRKICGLTRTEDVLLCHELGIEFTGFIFVPSSPRKTTPGFVASLPKERSKKVGVFAGASVHKILSVAEKAGLDCIQLHGGEDVEFCRAIGPHRIIKVLWPEKDSVDTVQRDIDRFAPVVSHFLVDAGRKGGGSGKTLHWQTLARLQFPKPWFLAGGIGPVTVGEAVAACHPAGVDMNSALETLPGVKDHGLVRASVEALAGKMKG